MKRRYTVSLAAFALLAGWYIWPLLDTRSEQDDCSFGEVSNAEYRKMLAEVRKLASTRWDRLPFNRDGVTNYKEGARLGRHIEKQIREFSDRYDTMEGKVASMHAVLRGGYGAIYWREMPLNSSMQQQFSYAVYKAKLIDFCWWSCWIPDYRRVQIQVYVDDNKFLHNQGPESSGVFFRTYGTFEETPMPSSDGLPCPVAKVRLKNNDQQ